MGLEILSITTMIVLFLIPGFAYAQESGDLGISGWLDDWFQTIEEKTNEGLADCEIEVIKTTNEECLNLAEAGFDALQQSKDLAFSYHHFVQSLVQFISPIALGGFVISASSAIIGLLFFKKIAGKFGKHGLIVLLILFGIGLVFMVLGDTVTI